MFRALTVPAAIVLTLAPTLGAAPSIQQPETGWQQPPEEVMEVLHAPHLPSVWASPTGEHLLLAASPAEGVVQVKDGRWNIHARNLPYRTWIAKRAVAGRDRIRQDTRNLRGPGNVGIVSRPVM